MKAGGELISNQFSLVEQDGKSLWLIYRDSTGRNYEDENGIHKIKYTSYRKFKKRKLATEFYTIDGNFLDTSSVLSYGKYTEITRKGKLIEQVYLDSNDQLVQPTYLTFAKVKTKHFRDGSWRVNYYNEEGLPSCDGLAYEQHLKWDTLWQINDTDTSFLLGTKVITKRDCKGNLIN